ncbi:hypothetical protein CCUS01_10549 [Colletotrichum cuscutae]|uniref:Uncharacterized protein n=1 Tax=Colletotrichum cuscutae TaxID=1209917 RepID=A0AAI9UDZ7_9PEZI|nr:hypothetical protein CCUS01_10549 [Colletotrichum cuscutae]
MASIGWFFFLLMESDGSGNIVVGNLRRRTQRDGQGC